jgi:hypothetical protein
MYTVTEAIQSILESSETASEAMRQGILNRTAFAKQIQKEVEKKTMKEVNLNTIVVALTRLEPTIKKSASLLLPSFKVMEIVVTPSIFEASYVKTPEFLERLDTLDKILPEKISYISIIRGNEVVSIIAPEELKDKILNHFTQNPKNLFLNQAAVTIKHPEEYMEMDNVIYTWLNRIVTKRISFTDIVAVNTELTVIFPAQFTEKVVQAYSGWITKSS